LDALASAADIVIGDFSPGGCAVSGIAAEMFHGLSPRLAVVSVSPFGLTGPKAGLAASDMVVQAASGMMFLTGEYDQAPQQLPPYAAAITGGVAAASAALAAARSARADGVTRRVDVSMVEAMASHIYSQTSAYVYRGEVPRREQRLKQALRMVPASDGFVYCAPGAVANVDMRGVAQLIDEPRLAEERFQTAEGRMQNYQEYLDLFVPPFAQKTAQEWFVEAERLHLTFALVQTIDDLFSCPQLASHSMLRDVPGPDGQPVAMPGRPFRLEGGPPEASRPWPATPGEHTDEVLRDWLGS
ncbi:MAG: CoA transferase, partial [Dehalococcoidia bacterium]